MQIIRHPALAADIRGAAAYYAEVSEKVLELFWEELDAVLASVGQNPLGHHFDPCGLRRVNFSRFPWHLLYEDGADFTYLVVLRHNRRHPDSGLGRLK